MTTVNIAAMAASSAAMSANMASMNTMRMSNGMRVYGGYYVNPGVGFLMIGILFTYLALLMLFSFKFRGGEFMGYIMAIGFIVPIFGIGFLLL